MRSIYSRYLPCPHPLNNYHKAYARLRCEADLELTSAAGSLGVCEYIYLTISESTTSQSTSSHREHDQTRPAGVAQSVERVALIIS
jgi:hypothetical protein